MSYYAPTEFEDFFNSQMSEGVGWRERYSDAWAAAEDWISGVPEAVGRQMLAEVDALQALPSEPARRAAIPFPIEDISEEPGELDRFLADFRARVVRELAGDRSEPLVDPRPPRLRSPQRYDISLPSAGSFPSERLAEAVVQAVLDAYREPVRAYLSDARPGVSRRLPPMRMRFDQPVGTVAVRDSQPLESPYAVVLLHDVGGAAQVFSAYPVEPLAEPPRMEGLFVLFGAWFHGDWVDEHDGVPDPVEQVRRFAAHESEDLVEQAATELEALRRQGSEDERRQALRAFCSYFVPRPPGQLDRFLAEALQVLRRT